MSRLHERPTRTNTARMSWQVRTRSVGAGTDVLRVTTGESGAELGNREIGSPAPGPSVRAPSALPSGPGANEHSCELGSSEVLALLRDSAPFRAFFRDVLASARFESFFFEMPPMTSATLDRPFELALIDAPPLARIRADATDFQEHFAAAGAADVLTFPNLGKDAMLVVPCPRAPHSAYAHLGSFVRSAPPSQVDALFELLARTVEARLSSAPLWVSTAGLGVSWLHVRLDRRPKYYRHAPYKSP